MLERLAHILLELILIALLLAEHAAAVFLHIEAQFPSWLPSRNRGEIPVEEGDAEPAHPPAVRPAARGFDRTDQQRGGEEASRFRGNFAAVRRSDSNTAAAVMSSPLHGQTAQAVIPARQLHAYRGGIGHQRTRRLLIPDGVDIGVEPVRHRSMPWERSNHRMTEQGAQV